MSKKHMLRLAFWACLGVSAFGQTPAKIDFGRDVLPILRQNCFGCHGPSQQMNGFRIDRKSSVFKNGIRRVVPGSSENSFLYHRLIGTEYGIQMPPSRLLRPEQINIIKAWIEQGADWPDSLANEADLPPINPKAIAMVQALHTGDLKSFIKSAETDPKLLNARGPEGSTPFMYAVAYCTPATLEQLLKMGADPNKRNDTNATALMWAAYDLAKVRILVEHGADVNARSDDLRTPLMIAAGRAGAAATVKLLLDRGANPNPNSRPFGESSPLIEAATVGDAESMALLIQRGADAKAAGQQALTVAVTMQCSKCVDLLVSKGLDKDAYTGSLADTAILGDINSMNLMLDHGADVNAFDPFGRTPLMYAAGSDMVPTDAVKLLIERGADVNAKNRHKEAGDAGWTVLDIAKLRGNTPVVNLLMSAGSKGTASPEFVSKPRHDNSIQSAIQGSVPLIQRADANFTPKAGCVSCHNNSLGAMALGLARRSGARVNEEIAKQQVKANVANLEKWRDRLHQGFVIPVGDFFGPNILGYVLIGLAAEGYKSDLNTDTVAMYIKMHQGIDGHWATNAVDTRPPLCSDYIGQTAIAMRALQLYPPRMQESAYQKSVEAAAVWLGTARSRNNDDMTWRLLGLAWAGKDRQAIEEAKRELLATQRLDGGWSDIKSMESSVFATGKAVVALQTAGLPVTDDAYRRGVQFLLRTQQEDGSWYVKSRALAFQPYFDAGFPHGFDQWISTAGTSWATMALALATPETGVTLASRRR